MCTVVLQGPDGAGESDKSKRATESGGGWCRTFLLTFVPFSDVVSGFHRDRVETCWSGDFRRSGESLVQVPAGLRPNSAQQLFSCRTCFVCWAHHVFQTSSLLLQTPSIFGSSSLWMWSAGAESGWRNARRTLIKKKREAGRLPVWEGIPFFIHADFDFQETILNQRWRCKTLCQLLKDWAAELRSSLS